FAGASRWFFSISGVILIAIASALELELALVPRTAMPAIRSIARQAAVTEAAKKMTAPRGQIVHAPSRAEPAVESKPAYTLDEDDH
ncbi:MAG: hypothetical protein L0H29_04980, partial [Sinobacteraceae bacterium]|nr:hypothetical protein [Nevskiaceae bacterium]